MYFSCQGGLDETQHVFIDGNDLPGRFTQANQFVIAETGFGSGLNFVASVACWLQMANSEASLHYISLEKHPFSWDDLSRALRAWPSLLHISDELLAVYPPLVPGMHTRTLFNGRVRLTLLFGDAMEMLPDLNARVDAWFLDGFAPAKNSSLWNEDLFKLIAERTVAQGSIATYTVAGDVRRGLQSAGFAISKRPGFAQKREMLTGRLTRESLTKVRAPWFQLPSTTYTADKRGIVIGAGIAGITSALSLAQRGWQITLIEQQAAMTNGASGNPAGLVLPRLASDMSLEARFYLTAFLFSSNWLYRQQMEKGDIGWHPHGVLQLDDPARLSSLEQLGLPETVIRTQDVEEITASAGLAATQAGIYYPMAGWLQPQKCCQALLQGQSQIHVLTSTKISSLIPLDGHWQVSNETGVIATAPVVILANGYEAGHLLPQQQLELQPVRGQLTYIEQAGVSLQRPLCYEGYVIPMGQGQFCIGASYDRHSMDDTLRECDHQENLQSLQHKFPAFAGARVTGGRVAFRASTRDHLPLVGPLAETKSYQQHYADLHHGRPADRYPAAEYLPGLYLNTGHGSRGLTSCPLAAELLAAILNDEPVPVAEDIRQALHPARFLVRNLKRHPPGE